MFAFCSSLERSGEGWLILNSDLRVDISDSFMPTVKMANVQKLKILEELNFVFLFLPSKAVIWYFFKCCVFSPNEHF